MVKQHCCQRMSDAVSYTCKVHADRFDCPDCLISYIDKFDEYGIIIHDGGSSIVVIQYCPWCGAVLPLSKRDEWFARLEELGFENPLDEEIPEAFQTEEWYRQ